jgi:hypothetical protein
MTVGYPDFQQYPVWSTGNIAENNPATLPVGTTELFSGPVTNFASVHIAVTVTAGQGKVVINRWNDAALSELVGSQSVRVNTSVAVDMIVPVVAPYISIDFSNTGAVTATADVFIGGSNIQTTGVVYPILSVLFFHQAAPVGHGSTDTFILPNITAGLAYLAIDPPDTSGMLTYKVIMQDESGNTLGTLIDAGAPTAFDSYNFAVPNEPIALIITNSDTVNHNATVSLIVPGKS